MSPANVAMQFHETGNVSFRAGAAVAGMTFVAPSANRAGGPGLSTDLDNLYVMATCPAGAQPAGVAKYDVPIGGRGGVHGQPGQIVPVAAGAAITAGQRVEVGALGKAIPAASGQVAGLAMTGCTAAGQDTIAQIKLL